MTVVKEMTFKKKVNAEKKVQRCFTEAEYHCTLSAKMTRLEQLCHLEQFVEDSKTENPTPQPVVFDFYRP